MVSTLVRRNMAQKSAEANVRIASDVARLAKLVASFEDVSISELLSEIVRPTLQKRYESHIKQAQDELSKPESKPKR